MRGVRNILSVACGYVAAVIGAGFASGQEIISFFVKYGRCGIFGILIACVIFTVFAYAVLGLCVQRKIYAYSDFLHTFFSPRAGTLSGALTLLFALTSVCVMTACAGEMGAALLGINRFIGSAVFALLCGVILFADSKSTMKINSLLGAIIVVGIIFCCLYILRFREHQTFLNEASMALSGMSYAGYNLITAGAVLSSMSRCLKDRRSAALASLASGIMLLVLMTLIWGVLGIYYGKINLGEIPMLTMTMRQNKALGAMYSIMLFFAVLTTGVSNGFTILDMKGDRFGRAYTVAVLMMCAVAMSGAGFSRLINTAYRLCGYLGIILAFAVICFSLSNMKKVVKQRKQE